MCYFTLLLQLYYPICSTFKGIVKQNDTRSITILIYYEDSFVCGAEGTYPTPEGIIYVKHEKQTDGTVKSDIHAPDGIKIITN